MSTFFTVLAVIALAIAVLVLLAPRAFAWLMPARHTHIRAVVMYLLLAMVFGFAARLAPSPAEETAVTNAQVNSTLQNATTFNATDPQKQPQAGNATASGISGQQASGNATGKSQEKDKPFMDKAQENITRAANATREFGRNVADQAGEIGSELVDGISESGKDLWEGAKQTTNELLNNN